MRGEELEDVQQRVGAMTDRELQARRAELERDARRLRTETLVGAHPGDGLTPWFELDAIRAEFLARYARTCRSSSSGGAGR